MSGPPPPPPSESISTTCGTTRRLSILKKFGNCLMKGTTTTSPSSPAMINRRRDAVSNEVVLETNRNPLTGTGDGEAERGIMLPPPPLPPTGNENGGAGSNGKNMRKLLEDLHRSRMSFELDQGALKQTGLHIKDIDAKISKLMVETNKADEKFKSLAEVAASRRTELNAVGIRNKVVDKTLQKAEEELNQVMDELHQLRIQTSEFSGLYLAESVKFGLQWNGTELGRENRIKFDQEERENLERQKRQLEFELADFLVLQNGVEECEKEVKDLSQRYKEHDAIISKQENELRKRIDELDGALRDLEQEEKEFKRSSFEDMEQLQKQIDEIQHSIASLQNQSTEAKATVKTQKNCNKRTQNQQDSNLELQGRQHEKAACVSVSNPSASESSMGNNQTSFDNKARYSRFQVPVIKPQMQNQSNVGVVKGYPDTSNDKNVSSNYFSNNGNEGALVNTEGSSNSNDEDMCLAAAAADISQSLRSYEPLAPAPKYAQHGPPPAKVRAMERQAPITAFMKQISSAKVIKRPPRSSSQGKNKNSSSNSIKPFIQPVAPVQTSAPLSGKTFQFKKKSNSNIQADSDKENSSINSDSSFVNTCVERTFKNDTGDYSNSSCDDNGVPELYDDMPYSRFCSSRALLTESQEQRLDFG